MAARIIANLIVAGAGVLLRAGAQAYRQALINAHKSGVTPESVKAAAKASGMSLEEAQKILGVDRSASLQEVLKKYNHLFERNEKDGTFYLQSKVYRARERIEQELGPLEQAAGEQQPPPPP
ncbi:hypothetical protein WJX81_008237 [Elliptochloris bilobata]|uniref:Mitochondrial import inner membrane translocase subunit tim16 n=1 Tax=Elliptochloris bilobata TaxID=381761 RepID=A0AAW1R1X2_9CHLO